MGTRSSAAKAAQMPDDLRGKRPALVAAVSNPTDTADADRLAAEVNAEDEVEDDGSIVVTLETDRGFADITVPPAGRWRSQARAALFSRGDDFTWAALTLSVADAQTWARLDPTKDDSDEFFARWGEETGQNLASSQPSNRASRRTRRR
jgi:hypothetical protein